MLDPKIFDDLSKRLADSLPTGMQTVQEDVQRNLKSGLEAALGRLNLVSMEEFEVQRAVLARTREQLTQMEARVAALEAQLKPAAGDSAETTTSD